MHKDVLEVLVSEEELKCRVKELAAKIDADYAGKKPLFIGVLKGSFVFMADLVRAVTLDSTVDFMAVSSYGSGTSSSGKIKIIKDLDSDIEGCDVIIVEDILDSGRTLSHLIEFLESRKPRSLRVCVLMDKPARREAKVEIDPEYIGFTIPDSFVVGYGLDYDQMYRTLPYIGVLKPEVYGK